MCDIVCETAEGLRRLRIQPDEKDDGGGGGGGGGGDTSLYPDRPGEPDCIYYLRTGMCGYGADCRFNHPSNLGLQVLVFFIRCLV